MSDREYFLANYPNLKACPNCGRKTFCKEGPCVCDGMRRENRDITQSDCDQWINQLQEAKGYASTSQHWDQQIRFIQSARKEVSG